MRTEEITDAVSRLIIETIYGKRKEAQTMAEMIPYIKAYKVLAKELGVNMDELEKRNHHNEMIMKANK